MKCLAITDNQGVFLSTEMDEVIHLVMCGKVADLMVPVALEIYQPYMLVDANNKPFVYLKLQKALYGCLFSVLLLYSFCVSTLLIISKTFIH